MASYKSVLKRPSVFLCGLILLSCGTSLLVQANPIPDDGKNLEAHFNDGVKKVDNFFTRAKDTLYGRAEPNTPQGLTHWELAGLIACAVVIGFVGFCCIGFCLCECIKELICCICCCKCCRD